MTKKFLAALSMAAVVTAEVPPTPSAARSLAVLDPADLQVQARSHEWGAALRDLFAQSPAWKVVGADTMEAKFREYKVDPASACHEFQCAFDAGNILLADFVAFGSVTQVDDWYVYTLNIVNVAASQVAWSRTGEIRRGEGARPGEALGGAFQRMIAEIDPAALAGPKVPKRGMITVLDLSAGSAPSRVLAERLATHLYATRSYDIMSEAEQKELLGALGIGKARFSPTDTGLASLGSRMGVSHLLYSQLTGQDPDFRLGLALYDVEAKRRLRDWPARGSGDFRKLLRVEDDFFSSLSQTGPAVPEAAPAASGARSGHSGKAWWWAAAGASLAASAGLAVLSWQADVQADKAYERYRLAQSGPTAADAEKATRDQQRRTRLYAGASGLFLLGAGAGAVIAF